MKEKQYSELIEDYDNLTNSDDEESKQETEASNYTVIVKESFQTLSFFNQA